MTKGKSKKRTNAKRQANLDGLIRDRAITAINCRQVMSKLATHTLRPDGAPLCGSKAQMYEIDGVVSQRLPECGRCKRVLDDLIAKKILEIHRNLWTEKRDDYGQTPLSKPLPKRRKVKSTEDEQPSIVYQQPMLPDELLPIGSGKPIKETVTNG